MTQTSQCASLDRLHTTKAYCSIQNGVDLAQFASGYDNFNNLINILSGVYKSL